MAHVTVKQIIEKFNLKNLTPDIDTESIHITETQVNRPGLQFAGYFEHFDAERIQVVGNIEYSYLSTFSPEEQVEKFERLLQMGKVPCIVMCRDLQPTDEIIECAVKYNVPFLLSEKMTSNLMSELIRWLNVQLAPSIFIHGVLVDVYGEGLLIIGESGIGKSEAALELIRRGHRLVTDDVVEIRKVSDDTLVGTSPEVTRHLIELRGIGIIDVKTLFGIECVKESQTIDLVIKLEEWKKDSNYDRFGLEEEYIEYLGNKVVCQALPIRSGRNLAVICEAAAVNHRQKKMGYNAAKELYKRVQENLKKGQ